MKHAHNRSRPNCPGRHYRPHATVPRLWPLLLAAGLLGAAQLFFVVLRENRHIMDNIYASFTAPFYRFMGWLTAFVPFSVAEALCVLLVLCCLFFIGCSIRQLVRRPGHFARLLVKKVLTACVAVLAVYAGCSYLWGVCYYVTPFEEKACLTAEAVSVQALGDTAALYAELVNESALLVNRNRQGEMDVSPAAVLAASEGLYAELTRLYPFLQKNEDSRAKPLFFSEGMSFLGYTGIFFPFTGEANVNSQAPVPLLPSTIAHELAHARGIGPEQTANFVAILACTASKEPNYVYSGALLGYLHLSNALYSADPDRWEAISQTIRPEVRADLAVNNAYWARYETPVSEAADAVYEGFLQGYSQDLGLKSYGAVVDLLVAHHRKVDGMI